MLPLVSQLPVGAVHLRNGVLAAEEVIRLFEVNLRKSKDHDLSPGFKPAAADAAVAALA
jgi:hypothetical protein